MTRAPFNRNRLAEATSPYLLQHKDNPVHWQPWEATVFDEARRRNVPVLLSIGYAACHWCHVMAHESFEDNEIAELMNAHFVCIKLDREERPDLDEIYMNALTMMGEQGGWPLTVCLDADGAPFWGGTYFPKTPQYGRPGFLQILTEISRVWTEAPDKIAANTKALTKSLTAKAEADARGDMPADLPARAAQNLAGHMDLKKGGLTGAPKFPQPFLYAFLRQQGQVSGDARIKKAVHITAQKICQGGIYDHIGGGFARYSVDADWLVPHFEKMLYDNALMINLLCDVYRDSGDALYAARIAETVDWLMRDMMTEGGAFAASLDADTEGEEGKFYVWGKREIDTLLGAAANDFCHTYGVTENGNFEGLTVLHLLPYDAPADNFTAARSALLAARATRTPPPRDDKILADWNAMMVAALVAAARLFDNDEWLALAEAAYQDARKALTDTNGDLRHAARQGKRLPLSLAADYGFWGLAAAALYQATTRQDYLDDAMAYAADLHEKFHDATRGGYLSNERDQETLLVNNRAVHDNAQPSANATALQLFSSLAVLTGDMRWHEKAAQGFAALAGHLAQHYPSMTSLLSAHLHHKNPLCIIIIGDDAHARAMEKTALTHAVCFAHILRFDGAADLPPDHPAAGKTKINGASAAYVCPGQICLPPLTDSDSLSAALDAVLSERHSNIDT